MKPPPAEGTPVKHGGGSGHRSGFLEGVSTHGGVLSPPQNDDVLSDGGLGATLRGDRHIATPLGLGTLRFERVASSCKDLSGSPGPVALPPPPPPVVSATASPRPRLQASDTEGSSQLFSGPPMPITGSTISAGGGSACRAPSRPAVGGAAHMATRTVSRHTNSSNSTVYGSRGYSPSPTTMLSHVAAPPPRRSESFTPAVRLPVSAEKPQEIRAPSSGVSTTVSSVGPSLRASSTVVSGDTLRSPSGSQSPRWHARGCEANDEDLIHQHVRYFLRHHPKAASCHTVTRMSDGFYDIDGKQVEVEWQHHPEVGQPGHLVVVDGPLRQPFADYLIMSEANAEYDTQPIAKMTALHHVPKESRMTFDDTDKKYTRLEAMRVAKEQANIREKAADYTKEGRQVPGDLVKKYNKTLRQKLGRRGGNAANREDSPPPPPPAIVDENRDPMRNLEAAPNRPPAGPPLAPLLTPTPPSVAAAPAAAVAIPSPEQASRVTPAAGGATAEALGAPAVAAGTTPAALQANATPACWMHRGISLNGMPSFVPPMQVAAQASTATPMTGAMPTPSMQPPPAIARSWSGTGLQHPVAFPQAASIAPTSPMGAAAAAAAAVAAGRSAGTGAVGAVTPLLAAAMPGIARAAPHGACQASSTTFAYPVAAAVPAQVLSGRKQG